LHAQLSVMHVALVVGRYSRFFLCARPQAQGAQRSCLEIILCFCCMLEVLLLSILVVLVSSQLGNRDVPEMTKRFGVGYEKKDSLTKQQEPYRQSSRPPHWCQCRCTHATRITDPSPMCSASWSSPCSRERKQTLCRMIASREHKKL
jgi:hypothetical protein